MEHDRIQVLQTQIARIESYLADIAAGPTDRVRDQYGTEGPDLLRWTLKTYQDEYRERIECAFERVVEQHSETLDKLAGM